MYMSASIRYLPISIAAFSPGITTDGLAFLHTLSQPKDRKAPFLQLHTFAKLLGEPKEAYGQVQELLGYTEQVSV